FVDDLAAELDALVADVDGAWTGDEAPNLILALATERAVVLNARIPGAGHADFPPRLVLIPDPRSPSRRRPRRIGRTAPRRPRGPARQARDVTLRRRQRRRPWLPSKPRRRDRTRPPARRSGRSCGRCRARSAPAAGRCAESCRRSPARP